ncbi:hypothetical protein [Lacticaseibacillus daqingensis]|uniref:hypothetical protein n=1 Tax=Lacticaseibacillus daqingensis TaxID=2486014 RepID=UPI000F77A538|nr:hypothetical protein [Lacticaseibacillus daqingensis]
MQSAASQTSTATSENVAKAAAELNLTPNQMKALTDAVTNTYTASNNRQQAGLEPLLNKLQSALNSLQTATSHQDQTASTVSSALSQLTNASSQLAQGNARLSSASETQLAPGAVSLATGSATLNSGINRLEAAQRNWTPDWKHYLLVGQPLSAVISSYPQGLRNCSQADKSFLPQITSLPRVLQQFLKVTSSFLLA